MSHEISKIDKQQGIVQAWHGLTEVLERIVLADSWLAKWDVAKRVLLRPSGEESGYCELVASDDEKIVIGSPVHCETYHPLTNREFLGIIEDAIGHVAGAVVESVGSVCNRGRIFVAVKIPAVEKLESAGRVFRPYLNFLSSHDQSAAFCVNASTVCTVCNNTFSLNLKDSKNKAFRAYIKHTKNMQDHLADIPGLIDAYCGTQAQFSAILDRMADEPMDLGQAERFSAGFLTLPAQVGERMSTRRVNQVERLTDLFRSGAGNHGRNVADMFSAITDYYTHESSGGEDPWRQVASSEFGAGQAAKDRAWGILQDRAETDRMIRLGDTVLANN